MSCKNDHQPTISMLHSYLRQKPVRARHGRDSITFTCLNMGPSFTTLAGNTSRRNFLSSFRRSRLPFMSLKVYKVSLTRSSWHYGHESELPQFPFCESLLKSCWKVLFAGLRKLAFPVIPSGANPLNHHRQKSGKCCSRSFPLPGPAKGRRLSDLLHLAPHYGFAVPSMSVQSRLQD
jgi:hypothetical protein